MSNADTLVRPLCFIHSCNTHRSGFVEVLAGLEESDLKQPIQLSFVKRPMPLVATSAMGTAFDLVENVPTQPQAVLQGTPIRMYRNSAMVNASVCQ
jgi:hypothetical protein